jgi:hypothetical protein
VAKNKSNEELDAEILALFAEAEQEVAEDERQAASTREAAAPSASSMEKKKAKTDKNVLGIAPVAAVPKGPASKVSPALQRFAFNKDK